MSLNCSIFKVPRNLRNVNEAAYEPQAISIGPYHHGKDNLKTMEVFKLYYLNAILYRRNETSVKRYVMALDYYVKEAGRRYYSEPLDQFGGDEKFVEMVLLDGCFIVELIQASSSKGQRVRQDPLLSHYILRTVLRDLLLVENQLPFCILWMLFEMTVMPEQPKNFLEMAINLFSINIMPGSPETITGRKKHIRDVEHLLGLLHDKWIGYEIWSPPRKSPVGFPEGESSVETVPPEAITAHSLFFLVPCSGSTISLGHHDRKNIGKCPFIPSATELNEAGVKFKKMQGRSSFDITFDKGVLSIPTLEIKDETESVLRDLVAYEQCHSDSSLGSNGFTDYVTFIDSH